jgi:hypothetical protein
MSRGLSVEDLCFEEDKVEVMMGRRYGDRGT